MCEKPNILTAALVLLVAAACATAVSAQAPAFDAASVRQTASVRPGADWVFLPGGVFNAENANVAELIGAAYGIETFRVVGGPDWVRSQGYDIRARGGADVTPDDTRLMLRRLLEERFRLRARMEPRDTPVFALVRSRSDTTTGPQLRPASPDTCVDRGALPINLPPDALPACGRLFTNPGWMRGRRVPLDLLATRLAPIVGRPVVNRTALAGMFDLDLDYAPELAPASVQQQKPGLFTALDEQLRLKLESASAPVDVLIIESVERPIGN
jgi:uncharacterized protein (TIGR03435 family)